MKEIKQTQLTNKNYVPLVNALDIINRGRIAKNKSPIIVRRLQAILEQDRNSNRHKTQFPRVKICPCGKGRLLHRGDIKAYLKNL